MDDMAAARYLNQRVVIPEPLRRQFDGVGHMSRSRMAQELAAHLGLRRDDQPVLVVGLLHVLLESLARAARREPLIEARGVDLATALAHHFTLDECLALTEYFGWADTTADDATRIGEQDTAQHVLGERLGAQLDGSLIEWANSASRCPAHAVWTSRTGGRKTCVRDSPRG
ncbi:MAG TPA: hypothetical protein VK771_03155 [Acidimicrobiia bacterium]|nr:hypothetical protein [Acidimicrobiia bacterium]